MRSAGTAGPRSPTWRRTAPTPDGSPPASWPGPPRRGRLHRFRARTTGGCQVGGARAHTGRDASDRPPPSAYVGTCSPHRGTCLRSCAERPGAFSFSGHGAAHPTRPPDPVPTAAPTQTEPRTREARPDASAACDPEDDAVRQVPAVRAARPPRPHLARQPPHRGAAVVRGRPARRQPGPHRPHGPEPQAARCSHTLVAMGYKEIEVGFPSASQTDFDFVRQLIEDDLVPDDVTIQVLTQCREDLIAPHLREHRAAPTRPSSTSTTPPPRCSAGWCSGWTRPASPRSPSTPPSCAASSRRRSPSTIVRYEYSPESYTGTEVEYAVEICDAVAEVIEPTADQQADHEPAGHGRDVHAQPLRRHHRVVPAHGAQPRGHHAVAAPPQRPRAARWPPPSWACWPAPTGSRAACSATASAPATSTWSRWA